jgi:prepilin-type N-terminal cleavage/methylation domain-containing protein
MTTTTLLLIRKPARRRGFTLVEVMIGAALSTFILAGVLSTFLFLGRSGANMQNYSDMETQARRGLEMFAEDVRQASAITWNSATSATIVVNSASITYAYDSGTRRFNRNGAPLITGVTPGSFAFSAFNVAGAEMPLSTAAERTAASSSTKQLQITLEATRTNTTVVAATNTVLSARFILRNKIVTA